MINLDKTLYGASLVALAFSLSVADVSAQTCTPAPTCETLGFTKSASTCEGRTSLKCPFDTTKYFCLTAQEEEDATKNLGDCEVGTILYSDKTCSAEVIPSKVAIGVVFESNRRLAIGLKAAEKMKWSTTDFNVPTLPDISIENNAKTDFDGKENTDAITTYCENNNISCPAFEYISSYKTSGTNAGDWYLPALGEVVKILENILVINTSLNLLKNNTSQTTSSISTLSLDLWSSTEGGTYGDHAWYGSITFVRSNGRSHGEYEIRPVLAF